ncbi:phosphotransferase family protein [Candidatus Eisenbacteria bacterium]|uniref:Phosphotransferase family protein n=1 Tax=Eiseniibacteriota bacterium TaxID=2212470 RepID=A0ABV6YJN4_UNCEI
MTETPSQKALEWVRRQLDWPTSVESIQRLRGATSSSLYELEARGATRSLRVILRMVDNPVWLEESPDVAHHEAEALRYAHHAGIPAPKLLDFDDHGHACGVPAVLMSKLTGVVDLGTGDLRRYLERLATALGSIHRVDASGFSRDYRPWFDVVSVRPPSWTSCADAWERSISVVEAATPTTERCFLHRDYHPTNVLWVEDAVSGIVDWPNACVGPRGVDVAHCRVNLVALHGQDAADVFLREYQTRTDPGYTHDPFWDLNSLLCQSREPPLYRPWLEFGAEISEQTVCTRRDDFLQAVLAELGA